MHYVYVLKSLKDSNFSIGSSGDLKRRITEHQMGKVISTRNRKPFVLVFYEAFARKEDAIRRERYFKTSKGKTTLRIMLKESLQ